jgi:Ran GTPase-activating protein (RanGAP) involved in mRNA processing and transport
MLSIYEVLETIPYDDIGRNLKLPFDNIKNLKLVSKRINNILNKIKPFISIIHDNLKINVNINFKLILIMTKQFTIVELLLKNINNYNYIDYLKLKLISNIIKNCPQLEKFDFEINYIKDHRVNILYEALVKCKHLKYLNLGYNDISPKKVKILTKSLNKITTLEEFIFNSNNIIGDNGINSIIIALMKCKITYINFDDTNITVIGATILAKMLLHFTYLQKLSLYGNSIGDEGISILAEVLPLCNLVSLNICGNNLGHHGAKSIALVLPKCTLTELFIGFNEITDKGANSLISVLPQCKLATFDISQSNLGLDVATNLELVLPHCTILTELFIGGNTFTEKGIKSIINVIGQCKQLTKLQLWHSKITDKIADMLKCILQQLPNFIYINLHDNYISEKGIYSFKKSLSESNIECFFGKQNDLQFIEN